MLKRWLLAMMVRIRLLIMITFCFILFLYKPDCINHRKQHILPKEITNDMKHRASLQEHDEGYHLYTASLNKQIFHLKYALREKRHLQKSVQKAAIMHPVEVEITHKSNSELEMFLHKQLHRMKSNLSTNIPNEYAVVPFESFTLRSVCQLDTGLTKEPVRNTLRREVAGALEAALHILNGPKDKDDPQNRKTYSPRDFFEGIFQSERDKGSLYDLTFRENTSLAFRRLEIFRPFSPLQTVKEETIDTSRMLINIIVPLATRIDTFQQFMNNFRIIKSRNFSLIHRNEKFSRGRALNMGARAWRKSNVLLFFCDVDVHFTVDFLNSCRINSQPGKRVFYPIPFNQYNPDVIYGHQIPSFEKQQIIGGESISIYLRSRSSLMKVYVACIYKAVGSFIFGAAVNQSLTDIAKYTIGRLRPHFLSICKPNWSLVDCKSGYIEKFSCTGDKTLVNEGRMKAKWARVIRPTIQFFLISASVYVGLSRVSDYKHHWSDVLTGFLQGAVVAIFTDPDQERLRLLSAGLNGEISPGLNKEGQTNCLSASVTLLSGYTVNPLKNNQV
ncbi:Chondroitin sulfate N-acetylgalactosaminyltransferase 1 [Bagarius yarrelli]|uniref:Hexosyltransferase n=1 Tax=Bagarius yarrelli TaxID=175774 RepID=A0A556TXL1_BAGYA|nr:Chondroitin sulfate N-acetylgalactosaminyltransferase 1 [Bagarius yarrelli]